MLSGDAPPYQYLMQYDGEMRVQTYERQLLIAHEILSSLKLPFLKLLHLTIE